MQLEAAARRADVRVRPQGRIQLYSAGAGGASVASATPVFKFVKPEELVKCALLTASAAFKTRLGSASVWGDCGGCHRPRCGRILHGGIDEFPFQGAVRDHQVDAASIAVGHLTARGRGHVLR
jgi:hypothetical protein